MELKPLLRIIDALNHGHRLKILGLCWERKMYVSELSREMGISRPLLYLHVRKLEKAGLIKSEYEITGGRSYRYYTTEDFRVEITPEVIKKLGGRENGK